MPSPFPGMDPYLEDPDLWPDVHARLITTIGEQLTPKLRPRYVARVEVRTYVFGDDDPAEDLYIVPDARIIERGRGALPANVGGGGVAVARAEMAAPIDVTGLMPQMARDRYLEIRDPVDRRVVTVIEILSPSNKVRGSAGQRAFLKKRQSVADSDASWLEIDLLRAGIATLNVSSVPRSAYRAYANRTTSGERRQLAWPILLRERLPVLPVPLNPGEPDVPLDLQAALDVTYQAAGYDLDVDYGLQPSPSLKDTDADWADEILRAKGLRHDSENKA